MKLVEDDLKKVLMTIFGQYIKYSENPMARRNGCFYVLKKAEKRILIKKGVNFDFLTNFFF